METNFRKAIKNVVLWGSPKAFLTYTKLYIAALSAFLSLPLIDGLKNFTGFEEISMVIVGGFVYKVLLPKFNRDSLIVSTLIYGYISLILLIWPSINKFKSVNING